MSKLAYQTTKLRRPLGACASAEGRQPVLERSHRSSTAKAWCVFCFSTHLHVARHHQHGQLLEAVGGCGRGAGEQRQGALAMPAGCGGAVLQCTPCQRAFGVHLRRRPLLYGSQAVAPCCLAGAASSSSTAPVAARHPQSHPVGSGASTHLRTGAHPASRSPAPAAPWMRHSSAVPAWQRQAGRRAWLLAGAKAAPRESPCTRPANQAHRPAAHPQPAGGVPCHSTHSHRRRALSQQAQPQAEATGAPKRTHRKGLGGHHALGIQGALPVHQPPQRVGLDAAGVGVRGG